MENIIGARVKINCPVRNNGRTFYGIIKGIKKQTENFTTVSVLIDGNKKCTSMALGWMKII